MQKDTGLSDLRYCSVSHCYGAQAVSLTFPNGFKFSYSGDCRPSKQFAKIGQGSTVLLHEATFDDEMKGDAIAKKHSTISEAIGVGVAMKARRVLLTHFSQRYSKLPTMDDLDKKALKLEDAEEAGPAESEAAEELIDDVGPQDQPIHDLLNSLDSEQQGDKSLSDAHQEEDEDPPPVQTGEDTLPPTPNTDMKVGVAFDYMSVKVKDIMLLEKFTPALRELYREKEMEANDRPESSASVRLSKNEKKEKSKMGTAPSMAQERTGVDGVEDGKSGKAGDEMEGVETAGILVER